LNSIVLIRKRLIIIVGTIIFVRISFLGSIESSNSNQIGETLSFNPKNSIELVKNRSNIEDIDLSKTNAGADIPTRVPLSVSPNRQQRISSKPLSIESEHQEANIVISQKDLKKWTTPRERA